MEVNGLFESPIIERRNRHQLVGVIFVLIILCGNLILTNYNNEHFVPVTILPGIAVLVVLVIWRACLFIEELFHVQTLCSGDYITLLKRTFTFNSASTTVSSVLIFVLASSFQLMTIENLQLHPIPLCLSFCAFILLYLVTDGKECPTWEAHAMRQFNGLDYGSGMAHSFFHGYLKVILPSKGDNNKSFRGRVEAFMEKNMLTDFDFPVKKLIVLIPSSGFSFPILSDEPSQTASDADIEPVEALQDHLRDRAGTKQRVYRGGAYRIRMKTGNKVEVFYAVAEGATAILTFQEASSVKSPEADHLCQHKVDIVSNFYRTLKKLINDDKDVRHLVDLIYYNDEDIANRTDVVALLQTYLLKASKDLRGF